MLYAIRHITQYHYSQNIKENVMEVRKHPITNQQQRCLNFLLTLEPEVRVFRYQDHLGNLVHHFDVPWSHTELSILGESVVEVRPAIPARDFLSWEALNAQIGQRDLFDMLQSSHLVDFGHELGKLGQEWQLSNKQFENPFQLAEEINRRLPQRLTYERNSTRVDSPASSVVAQGSGVCQDFAHVMLGLLRQLRIPCRYISGYRYNPEQGEHETSHAWVEAYVLESGWCGFDPSRGSRVDESYVTNCVGRDYADCPPTRGVYRGVEQAELRYAVQIRPAEQPAHEDNFIAIT
jgi:transglutaminase-like putative cysteine protease